MKKKIAKIVLAVMIIAVMIFSAVTAGYAAAGYKKNLEAWFGLTKISYNGQDLTTYAEPFSITDIYGRGTTYVPLRKMADIFKIDIQWDGNTNTVVLKNTDSAQISTLKSDIILKDAQIAQLQSTINDLRTQLNFYENGGSGSGNLATLEDALNDDYNEYRNIEFEISLDGDEDDIEVEIEVDLDDYDDEWDDLSDTRRTTYLQNICDDILDEFEDADIEGTVLDSSKSRNNELLSFYTNSRGAVVIGSSSTSGDLEDLEDNLNDRYSEDLDDIESTIEVEGDEDDITFNVYIDLDDYDDEWDDLSDSKIEDFMYDIRYYILYTYYNANVHGVIIDSDQDDEIAELREAGGGTVFERFE